MKRHVDDIFFRRRIPTCWLLFLLVLSDSIPPNMFRKMSLLQFIHSSFTGAAQSGRRLGGFR